LRGGNVDFVPDGLALILSFAGVALALITAWIGGELVYRLGVGVDPGATHFSYTPVFLMAGLMHPLSAVIVYKLLPDRYFEKANA
jgi:hypothetical protein